LRRAIALTLVLVLAGAASARAEGSLTIGMADGTSTYYLASIEPGHTVDRHLRVGNSTPDPLTAKVYVGAATNHRDQFQWGDGHAQNALTRWTTVRPASATIPSQRAVDVTVTIHVPDGVQPGKHYAVVWAELPRSDTGVVNRVGMRIYLTVTKPTDSKTGLVVTIAVLLLLALAVSAIVLAARRRGSAHGDSTTASP
jgi:hypothetical protein